MIYIDKLKELARSTLGKLTPGKRSVLDLVGMATDSLANVIREEARTQAYRFLAKSHRTVMFTIVWQNALLLASLFPVYLLHSALPFYLAYAVVASWSIYSTVQIWPFVRRMVTLGSLSASVAAELHSEMEAEIEKRQYLTRAAIKLLQPDLKKIAMDVASDIKADVMASALNMFFMLSMAFVAFRLFAIPWLEHRILVC